jgi:hypothetical protein
MRYAVALVALLCGVAVADDAWTRKVVARGDEIGKKVSKLRGLKIKKPLAMGVMSEAELRTRILTRLDEDSPPAERAAEAAMVKRWGVVAWDLDLDQLTVDLLTEQIAGFYDPTEKKLYVADKPEGGEAWADMLMAHEIVKTGVFRKHVKGLRRRYEKKAGVMVQAIRESFPGSIAWAPPEGGLYVWAKTPSKIKTGIQSPFFQSLIQRDVLYVPGQLCYGRDPTRARPDREMRISFGGAKLKDIPVGIRRMGETMKEFLDRART